MKVNNEIKSTARSKYRCQYHIVFAPKFRRKEIYGKLKKQMPETVQIATEKDTMFLPEEKSVILRISRTD